ncbi:MAG: hypothetical protein RL018_814 [Pseudomonadota bacterium]|jgi:hypothetical protein
MSSSTRLNQLFDQLDDWRHLPAYQLERRADIFFSLYLPEVLFKTKSLGLAETPILIPEFPCRLETVHATGGNQSFKVDYLAIAKASNSQPAQSVFVELKTEMGSRNDKQDANLEAAQLKGMQALLKGISVIQDASKEKGKYQHLEGKLNNAAECADEITIVYVQPINSANKSNVITFDEFADVVEKHTDLLSLRFAKSLREWARYEAGKPKTKNE